MQRYNLLRNQMQRYNLLRNQMQRYNLLRNQRLHFVTDYSKVLRASTKPKSQNKYYIKKSSP